MTEKANKRKLTDVVSRKACRAIGIETPKQRVELRKASGDMAVRPQEKKAEAKKVPQS